MSDAKAAEVASIYVIKHPITKEIRYVGRTIMPINNRKNAHMNAASGHKFNRPICVWIRELKAQGLKPEFEVLEMVNGFGIEEEKKHLVHLLSIGCNMLNVAPPGGGATHTYTINWSPELIARFGKETDLDIAASIGFSREAVSYMRRRLGIPKCPIKMKLRDRPVKRAPKKWFLSPETVALFGKMSDIDLAKTIGCHKHVINKARRRAGIPPFDKRKGGVVTPVKIRKGKRNVL